MLGYGARISMSNSQLILSCAYLMPCCLGQCGIFFDNDVAGELLTEDGPVAGVVFADEDGAAGIDFGHSGGAVILCENALCLLESGYAGRI